MSDPEESGVVKTGRWTAQADEPRTIYGVTGYDIGGNSGYVVYALFTTEVEARRYAAENEEYDVEEFALYERAPAPYSYWTRVAHVFPDGEVENYGESEDHAQPPGEFHALDGWAFDGHAQGHCGWHVYVSGRERQAVKREAAWLIRQARAHNFGGVCQGCGRTSDWKRDFVDDKTFSRVDGLSRPAAVYISRTRDLRGNLVPGHDLDEENEGAGV